MNRHILLVEDDESLAYVIQDNLKINSYQTSHARTGTEALKIFKNNSFDLCLMDVMMPEMDGFECARQIRLSDKNLPILFLTARSMEEDIINGFLSGGDDYIIKPFKFNELLMRIKVFLRRSTGQIKEETFTNLTNTTRFDYLNLVLQINNSKFQLTSREGDLLQLLASNKNQLLKREDILLEIWGDDDYFLGRSLDVFISRLRKYMADDHAIEIRNHHGVGFTLKIK